MYTYFLFQKFKPVHQQRQCNHKYIPQMQGFFTSLLIYFFKRRRRKWNSPIPGSVSIMSLAGLVEDPKTTPLPWEFSFAITLSIIKSKTKQEGGVLRQRNNNRRLSNKTYALSAQPKGDETRRGSRMADAKLSRPAKTKITKTLCSG